MKPKKFFSAAIAEVLHKHNHQRLLRIGASHCCFCLSIFQQHARNVAALKVLASGFRLIFLEAGKARAIEHFVAFFRAFSEHVGLAQKALSLALRGLQTLLGLFFVGQGADLN